MRGDDENRNGKPRKIAAGNEDVPEENRQMQRQQEQERQDEGKNGGGGGRELNVTENWEDTKSVVEQIIQKPRTYSHKS